MTEHVCKTLELTGSSDQSFQQAIQSALAKLHESVRKVRWFQVRDTRDHAQDGQAARWQVTLKVGFTLDGNP